MSVPPQKKQLLIDILSFTCTLIKHTYSSHVYASFDHLSNLLNSTDLAVVCAVLDLLFGLAKRGTHYQPANNADRKPAALRARVSLLSENWGGKDYGVSLAQCAQDLDSYPESATTLSYEFYPPAVSTTTTTSGGAASGAAAAPTTPSTSNVPILEKTVIRLENVHKLDKSVSAVMQELVTKYKVPADQQQHLFTRLRLTAHFGKFPQRQLCVQARLYALAINGRWCFGWTGILGP